jgi:hypothetical protein
MMQRNNTRTTCGQVRGWERAIGLCSRANHTVELRDAVVRASDEDE